MLLYPQWFLASAVSPCWSQKSKNKIFYFSIFLKKKSFITFFQRQFKEKKGNRKKICGMSHF